MDFLSQIILITYLTACFLLTLYGLNCHVMIHLFKRRFNQRRRDDQKILEDFRAHGDPQRLPFITTQIPIYNELNVAERIIDAVAAFDYPPDRYEIQVLDDSTDFGVKLAVRYLDKYRRNLKRIRFDTPIGHLIREVTNRRRRLTVYQKTGEDQRGADGI